MQETRSQKKCFCSLVRPVIQLAHQLLCFQSYVMLCIYASEGIPESAMTSEFSCHPLIWHINISSCVCACIWLVQYVDKTAFCINGSLLFCIGTSKVQTSLCVAGRCLLGVALKTWLQMNFVSFFRNTEKWLMSSFPNRSELLPLLRLLMIRYPSSSVWLFPEARGNLFLTFLLSFCFPLCACKT